jgi:hypothetical protein
LPRKPAKLGRSLAVSLLVLALAGLALPAGAAALPNLQTGFSGPEFVSDEATTREYWSGEAAAAGASLVRIGVSWRSVAPKDPPAGFDPSNPGSVGYDWSELDNAVRSATAHGLQVMFTVLGAPVWAEGAGRPSNATPGSWKPSAGPYGAFAQALATRYSGSYSDPLSPGSPLPRVRYFEAWNEPNLDKYLAPQWESGRATGATLYRGLVNSFYAGVKAAQPSADVIAGSLAPFGDPPGGERTPPVEFLRGMLCLQGGKLYKLPCPEPAHFDILSDHPIAVGSPTASARSPLDATTPDLGRLTTVLEKAESTGRALPQGKKPLWVTEFWYDTNPPDPDGVPLYRQARWYEQDLYLFWKQGARAAITLQIRDSPAGKSYTVTSQAGVYFLDSTPKPSLTAFRFPFVAQRVGKRAVSAWGIPPRSGPLKVQARRGGHWVTVAKVSVRRPRAPFSIILPIQGKPQLRAVVGGEASLPWKLG